jgi:hypothetical protein
MVIAWWRRLRHKLRETRQDLKEDHERLAYWLEQNKCPDCKGIGFWEGPRGGININVFCQNPECRSGFNIAVFGGEILMAERIHKGEDRYYVN